MDVLDLHNVESRASLTKMVMRLFGLWQIPTSDQGALLGRSLSSIRRYRNGGCISGDEELLDRIGALLGIHKSLRIIFPRNRDLVYGWLTAKNKAFEDQAPIEIMLKGSDGIVAVRHYLESICDH